MDTQALKNLTIYVGPLAAAALALSLKFMGYQSPMCMTAGITMLCAVWWVFEPIPIPATSLIPLALLPLCGVLKGSEIAGAYGHPMILLLLGGFILSKAMEHSGTHKRIAMAMIRICGSGGERTLVMGFMAASAFLSMWISNTATTLMLLPVAIAILGKDQNPQLAAPLLLGVAYSASLGGIGTPVGTPPNLIFLTTYAQTTGKELSFLDWMKWGVPVVLVFLPMMGLWLTRGLKGKTTFKAPESGPWRKEEVRVLLIFALTALAWITRSEPFGGWSHLLKTPYANDASVALCAVILMFLCPNGKAKGEKLLNWETASKIPWGILILFGGGIAIAKAFGSSGLSKELGLLISTVTALPVIALILMIALSVTFMTEITSNTATTNLLMPVLASAALASDLEPSILMVPAAMSASCAFMLPVATAPNSIVFSSHKITVRQMVREGFMLNLIGAFVITALCYFLI